MKKNLLLFATAGVIMISATATFTSCTKQEDVPVKNYYGVQSENNGTSQEAYYALFGGVVVVIILVGWGLKRLGNKK